MSICGSSRIDHGFIEPHLYSPRIHLTILREMTPSTESGKPSDPRTCSSVADQPGVGRNRPRLLVVSSVLPPYRLPEAYRTDHLCRRLAQRDFEVHLLTSSRYGQTIEGVETHPLMDQWGWLEMPRLASFLSSCRPSAVLLLYLRTMYHCRPMITMLGTLIRRILGSEVRFVVDFPNLIGTFTARHNRAKPLSRFVFVASKAVDRILRRTRLSSNYGTLLATADYLVVEYESQFAEPIDLYPSLERRVELVPSAPMVCRPEQARSPEEVREVLGITSGSYVVAYFGFLYHYKHVDRLLDAFALLAGTEDRLHLLIVGCDLDSDISSGGYQARLQDQAEKLGLAPRTSWTGFLENEKAGEFLGAADVCVFPFGISIGNSSVGAVASLGIPIIGGRSQETEAAFVHGENVYLYEPADNSTQLAAAIERVANDPRLAGQIRAGGDALHRDYFSWETTLEAIKRLLMPDEFRRASGSKN